MALRPLKDDTRIVTSGRDPENNHGVVNPPVYHASTILSSTLAEMRAKRAAYQSGERAVVYGRRGTPTTFALEDMVNAIEGGDRAHIYSSGLGAIAAVLLAYVETGDHVLVADTVYGPCRRFCNSVLKRFGVETTFYAPDIGEGIEALIRPRTRLVYVEAPGSLTFEMMDIPRIAEIAHRHDCLVAMDNTWASPLYCKPFTLGVDVSIQAGTKYIVGHSDVMIGTAACTRAAYPALDATTNDLGQAAGPDDIYLAQRGFRTLSVRLARHMRTGLTLASWLKARPEVECVMHPGLADDPGHAIWRRDFLGASGLFGVSLKPCGDDALAAMMDGLELFGMGASWGGYESLALVTDPNSSRTTSPWPHPGPTIRIHAGLEDPEDLIADLEAGLGRLRDAA